MYENGKIYKVVDNGYNLCYYGSTVQPLSKRFSTHKKDYVRYRDGRKERPLTICKIFDEYGVDNCKIELVELFPCNSKEELHKREGEHIRNNDCVNKFIPGRSQEEYRKCHKAEAAARTRKYRSKLTDEQKEAIRLKEKEYRETHKEEIREKTRNYRENNKDKVIASRRERYANMTDEQKNHRNEYAKEWRKNHKEEVNARSREKVACDVCGSCYSRGDMTRHERSKKHQEKLKDPNEI